MASIQESLEFIAAAIPSHLHTEFYDVVVDKAYFPSQLYEDFMDAHSTLYSEAVAAAVALSADQHALLRSRLKYDS